ncbi:hypothetical protein GMOD_00001716 [Pyrenophora seminiperda CCB06]|uniref:Uncharacterized protein n=1 Tax=Pyrenophora seminiperda CCB06 TaxID=1302712 RepID=A0A3M7LVX7_9PLEO|nr:hypothetical protein GMOD_00001716 [Pyrenophora seminiperda CCB06]
MVSARSSLPTAHCAHLGRCLLAGSRDACLESNGRRSQGTRCATLSDMDPTRPTGPTGK